MTLLPLLFSLTGAAAATPVYATAEAGEIAGLPGVGVAVHAGTDTTRVLRARGRVGLAARVPAWDTAFEPALPFVLTPSVTLLAGWTLGKRSTFGPMVALDALLFDAAAQDCGSFGCRFWPSVELGPVGGSTAVAAGVAWSRSLGDSGGGFDLTFGIEPSANYDIVLLIPRTELTLRTAGGWTGQLALNRFSATVGVGRVVR